MDFKELFNFKGLNFWHIANAIGLNLLWSGAMMILSYYFLNRSIDTAAILQLGLMLGIFLGTLVIGWLIGKLAADRRGPTYGVIGSLASAVLILFLILPTGGAFGFLLAIIAIAGGLNGGTLSLRQS